MVGGSRHLARACVFAAALGALAIPPLAVGLSATASTDPLWTALRVTALEAFTLILFNILTGAFRPWLSRWFKARRVHRFHQVTGLVGFALAVAHGAMVFVFGIAGYAPARVWMGPVMLAVLVATILTALRRRRLRTSWRWIHRLNYVVFAVILVHGLSLGADLRAHVLLVVCFGLYAAMVAAGLLYRVSKDLRLPGKSPGQNEGKP